MVYLAELPDQMMRVVHLFLDYTRKVPLAEWSGFRFQSS
jgi:hypothetical protein